MTTIRQLIAHLSECQNLDEPVIFEYYTKDHFSDLDVSDELWSKLVKEWGEILVDDTNFETLRQYITEQKAMIK
jgi:hypothetical protein